MTENYENKTRTNCKVDNEALYQRIVATNSNLQHYLALAPSLTLNSTLNKRSSIEYSQLPLSTSALPKPRSTSGFK